MKTRTVSVLVRDTTADIYVKINRHYNQEPNVIFLRRKLCIWVYQDGCVLSGGTINGMGKRLR